jgi:ABC-type phosphate/phosphonate transport system substrate-binding protein
VNFIIRTMGILGAVMLSAGGALRAGENAPAAPPAPRNSVEIGMPTSLFQGYPKGLMELGAGPFRAMMKANTGMEGTVHFPPNSMALATLLDTGKLQVGVMQGHELAWAKTKYPNLAPIAVTVPMQPVQAFCLVKWDCKAAHLGDLKDEKLALPPVHRDFCELFLAKQKDLHMKGKTFAGELNRGSGEDAIFDVIEGRAGCTVVDYPTLHFFRTAHPGQFTNLKILCQSDVFPNASIVVKKGDIDETTSAKFRKALLNADTDPIGKHMLVMWKLKGFISVPADYELQLKAVEKAYPITAAMKAELNK